MVSDLVYRLRKGVRRLDLKPADNNNAERALAKEAADEIERLRGALQEIAAMDNEGAWAANAALSEIP